MSSLFDLFGVGITEIVVGSCILYSMLAVAFFKKYAKILLMMIVPAIMFALLNISPESESASADMSNIAANIYRTCILLCGIIVIWIFLYTKDKTKIDDQYVILVLSSMLGGLVIAISRTWLMIFVGLELQAFAAYILVAIEKDQKTEASLKYFILGSIMSCIGLMGIALIYGATGSIKYEMISQCSNQTMFLVGIILVAANLLFKMGAAPFHFAVPDIYTQTNIFSLTSIITINKIGAFMVLFSVFAFGHKLSPQMMHGLFLVCALTCVLIGLGGALRQTSIRRLMGYGSIFNAAFLIISIIVDRWHIGLFYLMLYSLSTIMLFLNNAYIFGAHQTDVTIKDYSGLFGHSPTIAIAVSAILVSLIGIPPMSGFVGKYAVIFSALNERQYLPSVIMLLGSVVSAFYYIRVMSEIFSSNANNTTLECTDLHYTTKFALVFCSLITAFMGPIICFVVF